MYNTKVAYIFDLMAEILEIQGSNPFRVRSYQRAAQTVRDMPEDVGVLLERGELESVPGIGKSLAAKIEEIAQTGSCKDCEDLKRTVPEGITDLLRLRDVGPKTVRLLMDELNIHSVDDLEKAAKAGILRDLPGMGERSEQKILEAIALYRSSEGRALLPDALAAAEEVVEHLAGAGHVGRIDVAGSLRRRKETIGDIDILVTSEDPEAVMEDFVSLPECAEVIAKGPTKSSIRLEAGLQVDLRVLEDESYGAALHYFTGSKAHNIHARSLGKKRGLKISEYGVFLMKDEKRLGGAEEQDVFESLGFPFMPPELREDRGEFEAAMDGKLPDLLELRDLRGDLQCHTKASDGTDTIEEMAQAAKALGHKYLAITDHTKSLRVAGGLDAKGTLKHAQAIREASAAIPGFTILAGSEVDVLADGRLDLPDDCLAELDVVLAAIHSRFEMSAAAMTDRVIKAIENPHVHILAHPTGRIIKERKAYPLNLEVVCEAARENGVALEINAYPSRLDLTDQHARMARDMGVKLVISTDAHNGNQLSLLQYGVYVARRGWIGPDDVINAYPLRKLRRFLAKKKG